MLITFLGVDSFTAVGIALASDVLASAASALTYARNKNVDLKRGFVLLVTVILATIIGSITAYHFTSTRVGENIMGIWLISGILFMGFRFLFFPGNDTIHLKENSRKIPDFILSILCGIVVGFVCGFQGTGGGLWMLFALNIVLKFDYKKAVGTSVSIMSLTALMGAVEHFAIDGVPEWHMLIICVAATLFAAQAAAMIANRISPKLLKRMTGALMVAAGIGMVIVKLL